MEFRTPQHFQAITGGQWLVSPGGPGGPHNTSPPITLFSFDTRTLKTGDLFLAVRGEESDGHQYVQQAIDKGAAMVIVDRAPVAAVNLESAGIKQSCILLVPDTVLALQQIGSAWRDILVEHGVKIVAVTGSNGKTTTRNMIHCALSCQMHGTQSPKSFNNHLGVPLTLLAASTEDDFVVAEVGTNHPGEIAALAKILRPHVAVVTNIGTAHIGMFGSKDAIAAEKSSLFEHVLPGGVAVMQRPLVYEKQWRRERVPAGVGVMTFGREGSCDVATVGAVTSDERGLHFTLRTETGELKVDLPVLGQHNVDNALAAIAVARALGVEDEAAAGAMRRLTGVEMRMEIVRLGGSEEGDRRSPAGSRRSEAASGGEARGVTVIHDAYNANPDSMVAALSTLASLPSGCSRRVAVLGDMLELGEDTAYEHAHIGDMLCVFNQLAPRPPGPPADVAERAKNEPKKIHKAILIGPHMRHGADQLVRVWPEGSFIHFERWSDDLPAKVAALLEDGDLVLLKASRGLRFERLLPFMRARFETG